MSEFPINVSVSLQCKPGSFGAKVDEFGLHLPYQMHLLAMYGDWKSAEQFFLYTLDFPNFLQHIFGWTAEQCQQASDELRELLRGYLPDEVLGPPNEIKQYTTGSRGTDQDETTQQPVPASVADKLIDESVNRAFGEVISEVRMFTLRQNLDQVEYKFPVSRLVSRAKIFIVGQSGHEVDLAGADLQELGDLEEVPPLLDPSEDQLLASIQRLAPARNATIEGEFVLLTVAKPVRSGK